MHQPVSIQDEYRKDVERLPAVLRQLLDAELGAGNRIAEVGHAHPATPRGAAFLLEKPVSTRERRTGDGLKYRSRNSALCSGEFTDDDGDFHILEPGLTQPEEPDLQAAMEALRPKNIPDTNRDW